MRNSSATHERVLQLAKYRFAPVQPVEAGGSAAQERIAQGGREQDTGVKNGSEWPGFMRE